MVVIVALVELIDLVGELALALILAEEARRADLLEGLVDLLEDGLRSLVGDLRLNDDASFVFPHALSSRPGA